MKIGQPDYLLEWIHHSLRSTTNFDQLWDLLDDIYVSWQIDRGRQLLHEAKRADLTPFQHALIYHAEGRLEAQLGHWKRAIDRMWRAVELLDETEHVEDGIAVLNDLGMALRIYGNQAGADAAHEQALDLARQIDRQDSEAVALEQLGLNREHVDQYEQAVHYYEQALAIHRSINSKTPLIHTLNHLGSGLRYLGNYQRAEEILTNALALAKAHKAERHLIGQILGNLGGVYWEQERLEHAGTQWAEAMRCFDELKAWFDKIGMLNNLGALAMKLNDEEQAVAYFSQSFALAKELDDQKGMKTALTNLAIVLNVDPSE